MMPWCSLLQKLLLSCDRCEAMSVHYSFAVRQLTLEISPSPVPVWLLDEAFQTQGEQVGSLHMVTFRETPKSIASEIRWIGSHQLAFGKGRFFYLQGKLINNSNNRFMKAYL